MPAIIYNGDVTPCSIRIKDLLINPWSKGEVKELDDVHAAKLLKDNKNFSLVEGEQLNEPERTLTKKADKDEEIDLEGMTKDELLDLSVEKGIDTNYQMSKNELKELIREQLK